MNKLASPFKNRNFWLRSPVIHAVYFLLILLAPLVGVKLLFLLSVGIYLILNFARHSQLEEEKPQTLIFSLAIMLFFSMVSENFQYLFPFYIVLGAFAISVFGSPPEKIKNKNFSLIRGSFYLGLRIITAFFTESWIVYMQNLQVSYNLVFFIAVIGAVTGSLFESIPSKFDSKISVPLGAGMSMWIFEELRYWVSPEKMLIALVFSLFLGYLAYRAKIADFSALLSAALLGVLIIVFSSLSWFVLLLAFFILGGGFTRYRYAYKESIGIAQDKGGIRSYENVFSNSTAALALAVAYGVFPEHGLPIIYAYLGTVATATGDTLASEIGTTAKGKPRLITTLKPAEPGVDGAVSGLGELSALLGSAAIGGLAYLLGVSDDLLFTVLITTVGGFAGTNVDSLLGATFQKRGILSNSGVNFLATFAGAGISGGLYLLIS